MNDFVAANHERRLKFYYKNYIGIYLSLYKIVSMVLRIVSTLVLNAFLISAFYCIADDFWVT